MAGAAAFTVASLEQEDPCVAAAEDLEAVWNAEARRSAEAALSFLGLGIQPPTADWGSMVRDGASFISYTQWNCELPLCGLDVALIPLLPAGAIALLTVAVNFVVDWFLHKTSGLRDEK